MRTPSRMVTVMPFSTFIFVFRTAVMPGRAGIHACVSAGPDGRRAGPAMTPLPDCAPCRTWQAAALSRKHSSRGGSHDDVRRLRALRRCSVRLPALPAAAQDYPTRPIRVIASQGAGGMSDVFDARARRRAAARCSAAAVVVENRAGAAGSIGARACAECGARRLHVLHHAGRADDHQSGLIQSAGFDPKKSLAPVTKAVLSARRCSR